MSDRARMLERVRALQESTKRQIKSFGELTEKDRLIVSQVIKRK